MRKTFRPYIGHVKRDVWITRGGEPVDGIVLLGLQGVAAHLTKAEAYQLANRIVDMADALPDALPSTPNRATPRAGAPTPLTARKTVLVAADGTEEPPLPTTTAD